MFMCVFLKQDIKITSKGSQKIPGKSCYMLGPPVALEGMKRAQIFVKDPTTSNGSTPFGLLRIPGIIMPSVALSSHLPWFIFYLIELNI